MALSALACTKCGSNNVRPCDEKNVFGNLGCLDCGSTFSFEEWIDKYQAARPTKAGSYNLSAHPDHAAALGMLVSGWAYVEHMLCSLMSFLLRAPPWRTQTAFYAIVNNNARIDVMRALGADMVGAEKFQGQLTSLLERAKNLSDRRSGYVHKLWSIGSDGREVYLIENIGKVGKSQRRKVHAAELLEVSELIKQLSNDLSSFMGAYSVAYPLPVRMDADELPPALREKS
jgi:hypothetical protein